MKIYSIKTKKRLRSREPEKDLLAEKLVELEGEVRELRKTVFKLLRLIKDSIHQK